MSANLILRAETSRNSPPHAASHACATEESGEMNAADNGSGDVGCRSPAQEPRKTEPIVSARAPEFEQKILQTREFKKFTKRYP